MFAQFSDSTQTKIIAVFSGAQDPVAYPNQDQVSIDDARYKTYYNSQPAGTQQYLAAPV